MINVSNHPCGKWSDKQIASARIDGKNIVDIPFPNIPPASSSEEVLDMAKEFVKEWKLAEIEPTTILVQGEFSFTFVLTRILLVLGHKIVVACSERNTVEKDGKKISVFDFVQFREVK